MKQIRWLITASIIVDIYANALMEEGSGGMLPTTDEVSGGHIKSSMNIDSPSSATMETRTLKRRRKRVMELKKQYNGRFITATADRTGRHATLSPTACSGANRRGRHATLSPTGCSGNNNKSSVSPKASTKTPSASTTTGRDTKEPTYESRYTPSRFTSSVDRIEMTKVVSVISFMFAIHMILNV